MTMPDFPVPRLMPLYDPAAVFTGLLRTALVDLGVVTSGEHVVYGPGKSDENEPGPPRVCVDVADAFAVAHPDAGATNHGLGIVDEMIQAQVGGDVTYDVASSSVATIRENMLVTCWAKVPEAGDVDPDDIMGDNPALLARRAVFELRSRVLAVIFETLKLSVPKSGFSGSIVRTAEQPYQDGAACTFVVPFSTEVPSELLVKIKAPLEAEMVAALPEGDVQMALVTIASP